MYWQHTMIFVRGYFGKGTKFEIILSGGCCCQIFFKGVETVPTVFWFKFCSCSYTSTIIIGADRGNRVCWTSFWVWSILYFPAFLECWFDCLAHLFYSANFLMLNSHVAHVNMTPACLLIYILFFCVCLKSEWKCVGS